MNLGAYYLIGTPIAILLGFVLHWRAKGLWLGILAGSMVQAVVLTVVTSFTDWENEVSLLCVYLLNTTSFKRENLMTNIK